MIDSTIANYSLTGKRVWVAGHRGMVGSALLRRLKDENCEILTVGRSEVDLRRQEAVEGWIQRERPSAVIVAAATVGGIFANDSRPGEFLYDNLAIEANIIEAARRADVEKLLFLGSSCIYPRLASQPMNEDALLTGPLEPTNQWYAIAKIAGIMLCQSYRRQYGCNFISAMPTNLYGIEDNFDLKSSHVVPALLAKAHTVKVQKHGEMVVWGTGHPRRELMYVDDVADALVFLLKNYAGEQHINIGIGYDVTIRELAETVCKVVGIPDQLKFDSSYPDGAPQKLLDSARLRAMGWEPRTGLEEGLRRAYSWYVDRLGRIDHSN
jgi:GDP-L-fucose synthase